MAQMGPRAVVGIDVVATATTRAAAAPSPPATTVERPLGGAANGNASHPVGESGSRKTWRVAQTDRLWDHGAVNWDESIAVWLQQQEHDRQLELVDDDGVDERPQLRWALSFRSNSPSADEAPLSHMEETWVIAACMWSQGLYVEHRCSHDQTTLLLLVGASAEVLCEEATRTRLPMRMRHTRGITPFNPARVQHYVTAANGTLFDSAQEQQLVMSRINRAILVSLDRRRILPSRSELLAALRNKLSKSHPIRAKLINDLLAAFGVTGESRATHIGPATLKALQLVTVDGMFIVFPDTRSQLQSVQHATKETIATVAHRSEVVAKAGIAILQNPTGGGAGIPGNPWQRISPEEQMTKRQLLKYGALGATALTWQDLVTLRAELSKWADDPGKDERFTGLFAGCFPTHDYDELGTLRRMWADKSTILCMLSVHARVQEGKMTRGAHYSWDNADVQQSALWYQPIDEIRDYFGVEIALYFAWLGIYTQALVWPAVLGVLVVAFKPGSTSGEANTGHELIPDPDRNPLTLLFSTFIAVWSLLFQVGWERKRAELQFLWRREIQIGDATTADQVGVRPEFEGVLQTNFITGHETEIEDKKIATCKRLVSWFCILMVLVVIIFWILLAQSLSDNAPAWWELFTRTHEHDESLKDEELRSILQAVGVTGDAQDLLFNELNSDARNNTDFSTSVGRLIDDRLGRSHQNEHSVRAWTFAEFRHVVQVHYNSTYTDLIPPIPSDIGAMDYFSVYKWSVLSALAVLGVQALCDRLFSMMSKRLNEFENHRLHVDFDRNLVYKGFVLQFISNYCLMFYILFFRQMSSTGLLSSIGLLHLVPYPCYRSCLSDVQTKLLVIFFLRQNLDRMSELAKPTMAFGWRHCMRAGSCRRAEVPQQVAAATCTYDRDESVTLHVRGIEGACESGAALRAIFQQFGAVADTMIRHREGRESSTSWALVTMKDPAAADAAVAAGQVHVDPAVSDAVLRITRFSLKQAAASTGAMVAFRKRARAEEEQLLMSEFGGTFEDMTQIVVQYGYVALFAAACPLTPLLALFHNLAEIRSDAFKLATLMQRPVWRATESTQAWHEILHVMSVMAVLVNAMTLCFVGSQVAAYVEEDPEMEVGIDYRYKSWRLWALCLLLQNGVLLLRAILKLLAPTQAKWIAVARDTLVHQEKHMQTQDEETTERRCTRAALLTLTQSCGEASSAHNSLESRFLFCHVNRSHSQVLSQEELRKLCQLLRMSTGRKDVRALMYEMRRLTTTQGRKQCCFTWMGADDSCGVRFEEFERWWSQNRKSVLSQLQVHQSCLVLGAEPDRISSCDAAAASATFAAAAVDVANSREGKTVVANPIVVPPRIGAAVVPVRERVFIRNPILEAEG
jgi:hypothetical protein